MARPECQNTGICGDGYRPGKRICPLCFVCCLGLQSWDMFMAGQWGGFHRGRISLRKQPSTLRGSASWECFGSKDLGLCSSLRDYSFPTLVQRTNSPRGTAVMGTRTRDRDYVTDPLICSCGQRMFQESI